MTGTVAVVGGGVLGSLTALAARERGWKVSLFDAGAAGRGVAASPSCSRAAAGMLSPYCELESADARIARWGVQALELWPSLLSRLQGDVFFQRRGTLVVGDECLVSRLRARVMQVKCDAVQTLDAEGVREHEPDLRAEFDSGLYLPQEGQIDARAFLDAVRDTLQAEGTEMVHSRVDCLSAYQLTTDGRALCFDWVVDCRGLAARDRWDELRGVRGEIIHVHAPEVSLRRPVRVLHPRYPVYVAPRPENRFLIGATQIESEDTSPVSVRSAVELLGAAQSLHEGFAEGRIMEMVAQCRPALPHNLPQVRVSEGLIRANGLYRHGFLLSPWLASHIARRLESDRVEREEAEVFGCAA